MALERAYLQGTPKFIITFPSDSPAKFYWIVDEHQNFAKCGITDTRDAPRDSLAKRLEDMVKAVLRPYHTHTQAERFILDHVPPTVLATVEDVISTFMHHNDGIFVTATLPDTPTVISEASERELPPQLRLQQHTVEAVCRFAFERQRIFHRREVDGAPPPWTKDEVMEKYRLTNVHRELDLGTRLLIRQLVAHRDAHPTALLANIFLFRYFNGPTEGWEPITGGWVEHRADVPHIAEQLARRWGRAGQPKSGGGSPHGGPSGRAGLTAIERATVDWPRLVAHLSDIDSVARSTSSLRDVFDALAQLQVFGTSKGRGGFTAMQAALDLTYVYGNLSDDEWVMSRKTVPRTQQETTMLPRGSAIPLLQMTGLSDTVDHEQLLSALRTLRDRQDEFFAWCQLDWNKVAWKIKPRLTLADWEHTLCEYNKYQRHTTLGRGLRRFAPRTTLPVTHPQLNDLMRRLPILGF